MMGVLPPIICPSKNHGRMVHSMEGISIIRIGEFVIEELSAEEVYIRHRSGEGGSFLISELEEVIRDFYSKNF